LQNYRNKKTVLYLTYDGLLDPLGESQILPYLLGSLESIDQLTIISFEKRNSLRLDQNNLHKKLDAHHIKWTPLIFSERYGALGKIWDLMKLFITSSKYSFYYKPKLIHARGHISALIACWIKLMMGNKFLFDLRGLWVDERVDKGGWNLSLFFHRQQYALFKYLEKYTLRFADHIVVLTKIIIPEIIKISSQPSNKITVIPCCADYEHFYLATPKDRMKSRKKLNIANDQLVLGYHGSIGSMYRIDRFLKLYELAKKIDRKISALIITRDTSLLYSLIEDLVPSSIQKDIHIQSGSRKNMPNLLEAIDISVSFIEPSYARQASSPTKIAESFAMGIPVICNPGVGDIEAQVKNLNGGKVIDFLLDEALEELSSNLHGIINLGGTRLREDSKKIFNLNVANERYKMIYNNVFGVN
jgi:glycosyltransferase involved in cell wall biosynthesis